MKIAVGDIVAIRGDKSINNNGQCSYTPDQLVDGKYVRHSGHNGIWLGKVEKLYPSKCDSRALVGGRR